MYIYMHMHICIYISPQLMHARLCNGAAASLPWKLLRTYLESCANIVQAVVSARPTAPSSSRPPFCWQKFECSSVWSAYHRFFFSKQTKYPYATRFQHFLGDNRVQIWTEYHNEKAWGNANLLNILGFLIKTTIKGGQELALSIRNFFVGAKRKRSRRWGVMLTKGIEGHHREQ